MCEQYVAGLQKHKLQTLKNQSDIICEHARVQIMTLEVIAYKCNITNKMKKSGQGTEETVYYLPSSQDIKNYSSCPE